MVTSTGTTPTAPSITTTTLIALSTSSGITPTITFASLMSAVEATVNSQVESALACAFGEFPLPQLLHPIPARNRKVLSCPPTFPQS